MAGRIFDQFVTLCFLLETLLNSCQPIEIGDLDYLGHHKESFALQDDYYHYYVSANGASWSNANNDCQNLFGKDSGLVSIDTEEEKNSLNLLLEKYGYGAIYWTSGLYDPTSTVWRWEASNESVGVWAPWVNGTPPANPNALLRIGISYQNRFTADWVALWNVELQRYICEVQYPSTTPVITESTTADYTTTTQTTTTTESPVETGKVYQIISALAPMALDVYFSNLTDYNIIHAYANNRSCSNLAQVWRVEQEDSEGYVFRSALGSGSNRWEYIMHMCGHAPDDINMCVWFWKE